MSGAGRTVGLNGREFEAGVWVIEGYYADHEQNMRWHRGQGSYSLRDGLALVRVRQLGEAKNPLFGRRIAWRLRNAETGQVIVA